LLPPSKTTLEQRRCARKGLSHPVSKEQTQRIADLRQHWQ
jgi:hypothetical protein